MSNSSSQDGLPRQQLSLVMPAFNEEAGIQLAVAEAHEALAELDYDYEILVVDDGSSDQTAERVREIASLHPIVRLIQHQINRGYGAALRTGFEAARMPLVAFTDADGQFFLEDLERLVPLTDDVPIVVGYRMKRQDPWKRRFLSWGYNRLVRFLLGTGVRDCDCALKVFRREILQYVLPSTNDFFVNTEMLCKAHRAGVSITEVGVRHRPRRQCYSKVSLFDVPRTLCQIASFWLSGFVRRTRLNSPHFATRTSRQALPSAIPAQISESVQVTSNR
ncbi:MAG: glycosyltransferase family 2 protein [Planctomycetes bacterium]|nr:glycosyltransferase family 2 protein [Planctomycetota bacterium]